MKIGLFYLIAIFLLLFKQNCLAQEILEGNVKSESLGYGWIVELSDATVFIPAKDSISYPTISRFFEEKNKYGFEISSQFHPPKKGQKPIAPSWTTIKIDWGKEGEGSLILIPVMAYYKLHDPKELLGRNHHDYKYQGRDDNVTYQIVSSFTFKYITLE